MVRSSADVKRRVVGFTICPKLSGVEVKDYVQNICLK